MTPGEQNGPDGVGAPWWASAVGYQIYPRSFLDSNGDGIGDLGGVLERVDYLSSLGIDFVWLSPVYASPQDDNGYDISDYRSIHAEFGSLDDMDRVIAAFHERGIRVVMDLVVNHTSDEHPWFVESRRGTASAKRDWYIWRDPAPGGGVPNNWQSHFSGSAWELDEATGQYYLHLFSRKQPDLNWENPDVRRAVYEMMRWWLNRGVDGFRMDVINYIAKDATFPDGLAEAGASPVSGIDSYAAHPLSHDYLQEMNREVFGDRTDLVTIGEMPHVSVEQARLYTAPDRRELNMVFQFEHMEIDHVAGSRFTMRPFDAVALKRVVRRWQDRRTGPHWNSLYFNNHDQPRVVSRYGDDGEHRDRSAKALASVLHGQRGTPFVYQGEEIGMTNLCPLTFEDLRDVRSVNYVATERMAGRDEVAALQRLQKGSRDHARTPMQWNAGSYAGFSTVSPWMTVNPNSVDVNVEAQERDPDSVLNWYRALIRLRHEEPLLRDGSFTLLVPDHQSVVAFVRADRDRRLMVVANLAGEPVVTPSEVRAAATGTRVLMRNLRATDTEEFPTRLQPWEAIVLRT